MDEGWLVSHNLGTHDLAFGIGWRYPSHFMHILVENIESMHICVLLDVEDSMEVWTEGN